MDIQAILNATALITGGALKSGGRPGVYQGAGAISGVRIAYALYQEQQEVDDDDMVHVSFWDGTRVNPPGTAAGPDQDVYEHTIRMQLMVSPGRSDLAKAHSRLTPFVPLYISAFNANVKLKGSCVMSSLLRSTGIVEAIYPDRIALEFFLVATEKEAVTRTA